VASPEAKNLEAISKAIDQHNSSCPFPAAEVRMNPFEVERLGWDHIRGLPVVPDAEIGTGRFRIVCSRDVDGEGLEETEAIGKELQTVTEQAGDQRISASSLARVQSTPRSLTCLVSRLLRRNSKNLGRGH
jgi:hypothetical protein